MATAPAEIGTEIPGEEIPVDYVAEARKMGWTDLDEFTAKGKDPKHHIDAETFYNRANEFMPIAKSVIKKLTSRIDAMEKDRARSREFFSQSEERAYQRALSDIRAEQEAAVESGDLDAHRRASDKLDKLEKPTKQADDAPDEAQRAEELADWTKENRWYATNPALQSYADAQAALIMRGKSGAPLNRADLDEVANRVKSKFFEDFPEAFGTPAPRPRRNPVDTGGNRQGGPRGKTYADLPAEARTMCDRWVKNGTIKSKEDFVKSFDFDGFQRAAR